MTSRGILLPPCSLAESKAIALHAEQAGFAAVWSGEFLDRSGFITVAAMAAATSKIRVGTSIVYAFGRSPLVLANDSRYLDELVDGRLILGLGTGTPQMMVDWHGMADPRRPAGRLEELVPLVRRLWRLDEAPVSHRGEHYALDVASNDEIRPPLRPAIPVFTAGAGQRMIEVAGRVSDGLLCHPMLTSRYLDEVGLPALRRGAAKAGRDPGEIALSGQIICAVAEDAERARREVATQLTFYLLHDAYRSVMEASGFGREAAAVREAFSDNDHRRMVAAVSDEMIDAVAAAGTPSDVRAAVSRLEVGFDHVSLCVPSFRVDRARVHDGMEAVIEALR